MASTFFGLNIASSALGAFQASVNTSANNISNVQTAGYSKQVANLQASGALRVNSSYGTIGTGVTTDSITQLRDSYYDTKYWSNNSSLGLYEQKLYYMSQIEAIYKDDSTEKGFSTLLSTFFNNLDSLKDNASDTNVRNQFISGAQNLATYFNSVATRMTQLQSDTNDEIKSTVDDINATAQKIALLNKQINAIEIQGGYANELRDERALLVDSLSKVVPVEVEEKPVTNSNYPDMYTGGTTYTVKINGAPLVNTYEYRELTYTARANKINQSDAEGLYDLTWKDTGVTFNPTALSMSGTLKALFEIRDGNNNENFTGTVGTDAGDIGTTTVNGKTVSTITIENPSVTDVEKLTLAKSGILTIRNNNINYSDFTMNKTAVVDGAGDPVLDEEGNPTYTYSYTFTLEKELNTLEKSNFPGETMNVGHSIDSMGIPYYMAQMNEFIRNFASAFNAMETGTEDNPGVDLNGNTMGSFFVANNIVSGGEYDMTDADNISSSSNSYYQLTAASIAVAAATISDPTKFATMTKNEYTDGVDSYSIIDSLKTLQSEVEMYRGCGADDFLQCMISDISVDTQEATLFSTNFKNIATTIDTQRQSISGVDEDEEALDLVKFQNAYNLSSKVIQIMSEMYDRLITQTGV